VRLNRIVRDVGGLAFSKPNALVPVAKTDSGSNPFMWLEMSHTLLQDTPTVAF
jgi:hypothetical protein